MIRRGIAALALVAAAWTAAAPAGAQERDYPEFTAPVVDTAEVVGFDVEQRIIAELQSYQDRSTNQIAVAVVPTTGNQSIEDYANDLFEAWNPGTAEADNGVLLVVAVEDRELRIEVGSGLEGDLTDVEANRIIQDHMVSRLREGDYGAAIEVGTEEIRRALGDDQVGAPPTTAAPAADQPSGGGSIFPLLFGAFALFSLLGGGIGGRRRRRRWGIGGPIIWGGGFGGGGFGGGGFGGGGFGGGFGGGGGGGSSGGGASGGW